MLVERTAEGSQLRLLTRVGGRLQGLNRLGALVAAPSLLLIGVLGSIFVADGVTVSELLDSLLPALLAAGIGGGLFTLSGLWLRKRVRERGEQFQRIGHRARELLSLPPAAGADVSSNPDSRRDGAPLRHR